MEPGGAALPERPVYDITSSIDGMHERPNKYGGQSDVYRAVFRPSSTQCIAVAVKVLRFTGVADVAKNETVKKRLNSEISLWGRVSHPNVQGLLGVCHGLSSLPAMVSEWQSNGDIISYLEDEQIRRHPHLNRQSVKLNLLQGAFSGVRYLHQHDIVHGDIKGANVLVSGSGTALLTDFGFSKVLTEHSRTSSHGSAAKGTIRWMAPELFSEDESIAKHTKASDIWALGCLIIEVQSGHSPYWTKRTDVQVIIAIENRELPTLQSFEPDRLWQLVLDCCLVQPSARPSAEQAFSDLLISPLLIPRWISDYAGIWDGDDVEQFDWTFKLKMSSDYTLRCEDRSCYGLKRPNVTLSAITPDIALRGRSDVPVNFFLAPRSAILHVLQKYTQVFTKGRYLAHSLRPFAKALVGSGKRSAAISLMRLASTPPIALTFIEPVDCCSHHGASTAWFTDSLTTWSSDGARVASTVCGFIEVVETKRRVGVLDPPVIDVYGVCLLGRVTALALSPDGTRIAYGVHSEDEDIVTLWDIQTECSLDLGILGGCKLQEVKNIVFSHDGTCFASVDRFQNIYLWRVGQQPITLASSKSSTAPEISFTLESSIIVAQRHQGREILVALYNTTTGARIRVSLLRGTLFDSIFLTRSTRIIGSLRGASVCLVDVISERVIRTFQSRSRVRFTCMACSHNGVYVAAGAENGQVYVWKGKDGTLVGNSPLPVHRSRVARVAFSADAAHVISGTWKGEYCVSDIQGEWLRWDA